VKERFGFLPSCNSKRGLGRFSTPILMECKEHSLCDVWPRFMLVPNLQCCNAMHLGDQFGMVISNAVRNIICSFINMIGK